MASTVQALLQRRWSRRSWALLRSCADSQSPLAERIGMLRSSYSYNYYLYIYTFYCDRRCRCGITVKSTWALRAFSAAVTCAESSNLQLSFTEIGVSQNSHYTILSCDPPPFTLPWLGKTPKASSQVVQSRAHAQSLYLDQS